MLITGKVLAGKQRACSTPKAFPQLLSGFGPCIDTEEQHQWGRGSHPQAHTAPDSPALQGKARPWQAAGQRCQHPQTSLVPPEQAAGLAWPGLGVQDCPAPVEQPLVKFPRYALPGPGREQGQTPIGVEGGTEQGGTAPWCSSCRAAPQHPQTHSKGAGAGNALSRTTMHTLERREERKRSIYLRELSTMQSDGRSQ